MWQPKSVERALLRWQKWRRSIISYWAESGNDLNGLPSNHIRDEAKEETQKLGFPRSLFLEFYWICCIASDFNLDYAVTYDNIVIPQWLPVPPKPPSAFYYRRCVVKNELKPGLRIYPPPVVGDSDIDFFVYQDGYEAAAFFRELYYPKENDYGMFLPIGHELWSVLNQIKGRPKLSHKSGAVPTYSDRLAVKCATLYDAHNKGYVEIADKLQLPTKTYFFTRQSDLVRHLVRRGRKLIAELA